jgi:hypothetical protein
MNSFFRKPLTLFVFFLCCVSPGLVTAQAIDFESKPAMPVDYKHAAIKLTFSDQNRQIQGEVTYTVAARQPRVDSLYLHAGRLDIQQVTVDGKTVDYRTSHDSLVIRLKSAFSYQDPEAHRISIAYQADPIFGVHVTHQQIRFTSLLPMSTMNWLPVQDHPNNSFTVDWTFTLPEGWSAVANGMPQNDPLRWSSDEEIPAPELAWAVGPMKKIESTIGVKKLRIYYPDQAEVTDQQVQQWLNGAYDQFRKVENEMGREFPYRGMNFVWMPDHRWETDGTAASLGYLFGNSADISLQLLDRLLGQWYGVGVQMNQWRESQGMLLYRAHRLQQMVENIQRPSNVDQPMDAPSSLYDLQDIQHTVRWTQLWDSTQDLSSQAELIRFAVGLTEASLAQESGSVYNWEELSDYWYEHIGAPHLEPMSVPYWTTPDTVEYQVAIRARDTEPMVDLIFQAQDSSYQELVNAEAELFSFGEITKKKFTFTGKDDTVSLKFEQAPDNVQLRVLDSLHQTIPVLNVQKPAGYWLTQLREGETVRARKAAALGLQSHLDESDLQLALDDALEQEEDPAVKSAILETLGAFTSGATGTAQTFLNYAGSSDPTLQAAAARVLANYPENESVTFRLRSLIRGDHPEFVRLAALRSYRSITAPDEFSQFVQKTLEGEQSPQMINQALSEVFAAGDTTGGVVLASERIQSKYAYTIRSHALQLLVQFAPDADGWGQRYRLLENDNDPRIRFLLVRYANEVKLENRQEILTRMQAKEYDERVLKTLAKHNESAVSSNQ